MYAFFNSQFGYCPFVWMFYSRSLKNRINHLHERCLRIVYSDNESSFEGLLRKDNTISFHQKNLQLVAIELYKMIKGLSKLPNDILQRNTCDEEDIKRRDLPYFKSREIRTVHNGEESFSYLAPKIWELVSQQLKN